MGGVTFNSIPSSPLSGGSTSFTINANPVYTPTGNVDTRPWKTRISTLNFSLRDDECGNYLDSEIVINQTNYAINYGDLGSGTVVARMTDKSQPYLSEYLTANVPWRLKSITDPHQLLTITNPT